MDRSDEGNDSDRKEINKQVFMSLMKSRKFLLASVLIYAGFALTFLLKSQYDLKYFIEKLGPMTLGTVAVFLGFFIACAEVSKVIKFKRKERFVDVDDDRDSAGIKIQKNKYDELNSIKSKSDDLSISNIEKSTSKDI